MKSRYAKDAEKVMRHVQPQMEPVWVRVRRGAARLARRIRLTSSLHRSYPISWRAAWVRAGAVL